MKNVLLLSVDELWLKGKNRPQYVKAMRSHIKDLLGSFVGKGGFKIKNESHRFVVELKEEYSKEMINALQKLPGLWSITPAVHVSQNYDELFGHIAKEIAQLEKLPLTFKVETKRVDKSFPHKSMDVSRYMGHLILKEFPSLKVDVKSPEMVVDLKILKDGIYISTISYFGVGGLPVGTSGHLVTMISGGFDSPVASYLMSKRGCRQTFVFFYAHPFVGEEVKDKILQLASVLGQYQKYSKLYVVPFGQVQKLIAKNCREEYRTLLFRRYMVEASNMIADLHKADALLTGDSLGQVSSQTLQNIFAIDQTSRRSILRPLIGLNKQEIIALSRKVGTHDISILPHDDACSLFAPSFPVIKADLSYWNHYEADPELKNELEKAIQKAQVFQINTRGELTEI